MGQGGRGELGIGITILSDLTCLSLRCHCRLTAGISVGGKAAVKGCGFISLFTFQTVRKGEMGSKMTGAEKASSLGRSQESIGYSPYMAGEGRGGNYAISRRHYFTVNRF